MKGGDYMEELKEFLIGFEQRTNERFQKLENNFNDKLNGLKDKLENSFNDKINKIKNELETNFDKKFSEFELEIEGNFYQKIDELRKELLDQQFLFEEEYGMKIDAILDAVTLELDKNLEKSDKIRKLDSRMDRVEANIFGHEKRISHLEMKK